jgi:hypothetical protein
MQPTPGIKGFSANCKAVDENKPVIAAVNRCATQNQVQRRLFPQPVKSCPSQTRSKTFSAAC